VVLDVQAVLTQTCEAGNYVDRINYDAPCVPPLIWEDQVWANERIQEARRARRRSLTISAGIPG
jgi:hypothetical protein